MRELSQLEAEEIRVLGALLEKEQTTPNYYPMTLNALTAACNQKTNRNPVMNLRELDVLNVLRVLSQETLVDRVRGSRTDRWKHRVDERLHLLPKWKALITVLFLRGPQTPGELRSRTERMDSFAALLEIEEALSAMGNREFPLVQELAREAGQKETRWGLLGQEYATRESLEIRGSLGTSPLEERVSRLEEEVRELRERLDRLAPSQ